MSVSAEEMKVSQSERRVETTTFGKVQASALKQDFNLWSTLGVAFSYIATPLSIITYLAFSLVAGGSPYFFYSYITVFFFNSLVALSLAEMAGFLPHASGQIFWTARLAPSSVARALSYFNGAFTVMAWVFWTAGTYLFAAELVFAFVQICGGVWGEKSFQVFLLYVAFALFSLFMNTVGFKLLPFLSKVMIGYINIGALFVFITLLVRSHPKPSARHVFVDVVNETGWPSDGLVFFLSLLPGVSAINGFDSAAHLAEELPHPAQQVPQVMIGTVLLCGLSGLPMLIAMLFSITKPENLLTASQPAFQLFYDSFDSMPLTVIAGVLYLGLFTFASGTILTTSSRVWWSFARSGALPLSQWQGKVSDRWTLPLNAIYVVAALSVLIGLLILGPSTVLTGIIGSAAICFYISYAMPIVCLLIRGRQGLPKRRYFNLGRAGPVINLVSVAWGLLVSVFLCFPTWYPVTSTLMNYAVGVVAVGLLIFAINWVLHARKQYQIPLALYVEELHGGSGLKEVSNDVVESPQTSTSLEDSGLL
ncbi:hypothetical protein RBB50_011413 [Rhinocladiella similis]